jgi:spermidine/putrescine transport system permease protein
MFVVYGVALGFTTLLIAHVMFSISFVVVVVRSRLIGFDRSLEEAAADLGATPLQTFRHVTLPLLMPGVMAAALLAFALSIDDFVISQFNAGTVETFPLWVYGVALRGIPVQTNVLATILFLFVVAAVALVIWQQRRAERMAAVRPDDEELEQLGGAPPATAGPTPVGAARS